MVPNMAGVHAVRELFAELVQLADINWVCRVNFCGVLCCVEGDDGFAFDVGKRHSCFLLCVISD